MGETDIQYPMRSSQFIPLLVLPFLILGCETYDDPAGQKKFEYGATELGQVEAHGMARVIGGDGEPKYYDTAKHAGDEIELPSKPTRRTDIPYGIKIPGKENIVRSPHTDEGFVDVTGFAPGSRVKDPYSGKTFLVPIE